MNDTDDADVDALFQDSYDRAAASRATATKEGKLLNLDQTSIDGLLLKSRWGSNHGKMP